MRATSRRSSSARAVVVASFALAALTACAGRPLPPKPRPVQVVPPPDAGTEAGPPTEAVPSIEALVARGAGLLPSMNEAASSDDATKPMALSASATDTCFRAVVAASAPIRAWFEDEKHDVRGVELAGTSGLVPPLGPACARRGETLRLVVEPTTAITARAVVWRAP